MTASLAPAKPSTYVKVANFPGLYRHSRSGRYYGCKKLGGTRRERGLETCDRKIAERRLKEWIDNMDKVDAEVERTTLDQLVSRYAAVTASLSESSRATDQSIIKRFWAWWPYGRDFQVRQVRPSMLDEWLAHEAPRLRNVSYNGYTAFVRQLFDIAVKDRIIASSPASQLRVPWKKPQAVRRVIPTVAQFEAIVASIRAQQYATPPKSPVTSSSFWDWRGWGRLRPRRSSGATSTGPRTGCTSAATRPTPTSTCRSTSTCARCWSVCAKRGGDVSRPALVFGIKDAKKALASACQRLNLPAFSQRNLRQCLIVRLMRAGVNVKLIAKWQGHQDGGQLIMDTYTEALGSDDDEYERSQLAKIGGGVPPALPSGSDVDGSTSEAMEGPQKEPYTASCFY